MDKFIEKKMSIKANNNNEKNYENNLITSADENDHHDHLTLASPTSASA